MTRITPEISRRILELGARGFTLAAIGHELVLARSAVSKHLKDHGRARGIWWKTDDEVENAICRRYVEGLKKGPDGVTYASVPLAQLGREFDRSPRVVLSILRRRGVATATSKARWGDTDHRFFARVRRPDQAYFLGLLAADGNVTDAGYVQIKLKARDRDVLEKLKAALRSEHRLGNYIDRRKGKVVGLCFKSPWMAKDLARYGIVPRKSLAEEPWRDVPRRLLPHYMRGLVDGDGGFTFTETTRSLGFCGSEPMVKWFAAEAAKVCGGEVLPRPAQREKRGSSFLWNVSVHGHRAVPLVRFLYERAPRDVSMDCKRERAIEYLAFHAANPPRQTPITEAEVRQMAALAATGLSFAEIGRMVARSPKAVRQWLQREGE